MRRAVLGPEVARCSQNVSVKYPGVPGQPVEPAELAVDQRGVVDRVGVGGDVAAG